ACATRSLAYGKKSTVLPAGNFAPCTSTDTSPSSTANTDFQSGTATGSFSRVSANDGAHAGSGAGSASETLAVSETGASPGIQMPLHTSHFALASSLIVLPELAATRTGTRCSVCSP